MRNQRSALAVPASAAVALAAVAVLAGCSVGANTDPNDPKHETSAHAATLCKDAFVEVASSPNAEFFGVEFIDQHGTVTGTDLACTAISKPTKESVKGAYTGEVIVRGLITEQGDEEAVALLEVLTDERKADEDALVDTASESAKEVGDILVETGADNQPKSPAELDELLDETGVALPDGYTVASYGLSPQGAFLVCVNHPGTGAWSLYGTTTDKKPAVLGSGLTDSECLPQG